MSAFLSSISANWGNVDNTADLQSAINGCGGLLFADVPTVRIDRSINITAPVRIIGPGIDQWRIGGAACNVITTGNADLFRIRRSNVHLDGLNFNGTGARFAASGGKAIVVGDVAGPDGDGTITGLTLSRISASSHGTAVHFVRASNFVMERCDLQSYNSVIVENIINVDKGDSLITGCDFAADATGGKCVIQKSSGGLRIQNSSSVGGIEAYFKDCTFKGDILVLGVDQIIFQNCSSIQSFGDAMNYDARNTIVTSAIEIDCDFGYCGTTSSDQASTSHNGCFVVRLNGEYHNTSGQNIATAQVETYEWLLGTEMYTSTLGRGYESSGLSWLDSCYIHDVTKDLVNAVGSTIYTRNLISGGNNTIAGTLTPY